MHAKVEEFIKKMKEEEKRKRDKERDEHLISLGLVDETRSIEGFEYFDIWDGTKECVWDEEKNKYCKRSKVNAPIEVTDEEYREILKYAPLREKKKKKRLKGGWGSSITVVANIFLFINIIAGIALIASYATDKIQGLDFLSFIIPVVTYCILYYPLLAGFSKVVAAAEKQLGDD